MMNTELTPQESTMATHYGFEDAYSVYLRAYQELNSLDRDLLRHIAARQLLCYGAPEIGSSDINHQLCQIYKQYGSFSAEVLTELRDEWLGWAALPGEVE